MTPQFRVELKKNRLAYHGITATFVHDFVETAMNGRIVSQIIDGQHTFDLLLRVDEPYRKDLNNVHRIPPALPNGRWIPIDAGARVFEAAGPDTIHREDRRRRIVERVNTMSSLSCCIQLIVFASQTECW